ncbi:MAG: right-handed parallel beta-helix repeat-containing protein, partial [Candidatus Heimdallarchaeota archaeon]
GLSIYGSMSEELYLNSLYSQGEIVILNDNDFADRYSLPGSGTTEDPFRIENQCFEDTSTTAIVIRDTTKHFIIRNCSIKKRGQSLYISNIGFNTGKLINNTFTNDLTLGSAQRFVDFREEGWFTYPDFYASYAKGFTYIRDAPGIIIEKNIFQYSSEDTVKFYDNGLVILSSAFSVINNNTISFFYYGILAYDSLYINIENNFCINNYNGIYIQSIQESFIMNNICTKNTNGLEVYYSENVFIFENNLSYNTEVGLYSRSEAISFQIKGNYIEGNEFGLLGKFENCNITYNTFSLNTNYSIKLDTYYANFNNIHHNIFNNNNYEGFLQRKGITGQN